MFTVIERGPVLWVRCGSFLYKTGFFFVDGTLIDCGPPTVRRHLSTFLKKNPVERCLLTHYHEDHAGNASLLNQRGILPLIHREGARNLSSVSETQKFYRKAAWGRPAPADCEALPDQVRTSGHRFAVLHTPGHSPDHVCFYEPEKRWLFSGDLFISRRIRYLGNQENIDQIIRSLSMLLELRIDLLFCAHAGPLEDGNHYLSEKLRYILDLRYAVRGLAAREKDPRKIKKKLGFKDDWMRRFTGGEFSSENLVTALLASEETVPHFP